MINYIKIFDLEYFIHIKKAVHNHVETILSGSNLVLVLFAIADIVI